MAEKTPTEARYCQRVVGTTAGHDEVCGFPAWWYSHDITKPGSHDFDGTPKP